METTEDAFLGGRLRLRQPRAGYRAGIDPVLLAAFTDARPGEAVLDLGCGVGAAALCLGVRVPGLRLVGVEKQADYAALARENATAAGIDLEVLTADLGALPGDLRRKQFDRVMMNPPYHLAHARAAAADAGREAAVTEDLPLSAWVEVAARRLRPRGVLSSIQRAERLPDLLMALEGRLGSVTVLPLLPREGRAARLALVSAVKDGRAPFRLAAPVTLHRGLRHVQDGDDYAPEIAAVLRDAAPLAVSSAS